MRYCILLGLLVNLAVGQEGFERLNPGHTGLHFVNQVPEEEMLNFNRYVNTYNGSGVGVGDFDNDGLPDLFFTNNTGPDKLFRNKGNLQFEDISERAGITHDGWSAGVTVFDVNNDGLLDIYVCRGLRGEPQSRANLLYVNQGNARFEEQGQQWGVADLANSVQAAVIDYNQDGRLDLYVVNYPYNQRDPMDLEGEDQSEDGSDKLFINTGTQFHDYTEQVGLNAVGKFGLNAIASDIDHNGWPDLYVSNDFIGEDFVYLNFEGKFQDRTRDMLPHSSLFSMGADAGDVNNDGRIDIVVADMKGENHYRTKTMAPYPNIEFYQRYMEKHPKAVQQIQQNTMLLGNSGPMLLDVAHAWGMQGTDWSWSPLLFDADNDGWQELFISNGIYKDFNHLDVVFSNMEVGQTPAAKSVNLAPGEKANKPDSSLANAMFLNKKGKGFVQVSSQWGFQDALQTFGTAYADLDNDGDLDLITANMGYRPIIYRNKSQGKHYLKVRLDGGQNKYGVGAKIRVFSKGESQLREVYPTRGFQSSSELITHFGMGDATMADSVIIYWKKGKIQKMLDVPTDQTLVVSEMMAGQGHYNLPRRQEWMKVAAIGEERERSCQLDWEYFKEPLQPRLYSRMGPGLAPNWSTDNMGSCVLVQSILKADLYGDKEEEMMVATYNQSTGEQKLELIDLHKGRREVAIAPGQRIGCLTALDYDRDGKIEVFVGGMLQSGNYPDGGVSMLLELQEDGSTKAEANIPSELTTPGMVRSAIWTDYNSDGWRDLIVVGEWMGPTFFLNERGVLRFDKRLDELSGWYTSITGADVDNDGDMDYLLGNLGLNTHYHADAKHPMTALLGDFDDNGSEEPILFMYVGEELHTMEGKSRLSLAVPGINRHWPSYHMFAEAKYSELRGFFAEPKVRLELEAKEFRSMALLNNGGAFTSIPLPFDAQLSNADAIVPIDLNEDDFVDLAIFGNNHSLFYGQSRADANRGEILLGNGDGTFNYAGDLGLPPLDYEAAAWSHTENGFTLSVTSTANRSISLAPKMALQPVNLDWHSVGLLRLRTGLRKVEPYLGHSYMSQNSNWLPMPAGKWETLPLGRIKR